MRRALLVSATLCASCLPIPWKKTYVMRPAGKVRVVDEADKAIAGATVALLRIRHPYSERDARYDEHTDAHGEVSFTLEQKTLTVFPLMMHGVPQFAFSVCAEAPGRASRTVQWGVEPDGSARTLSMALRKGSRPCDPKPHAVSPKRGEAIVDAVEAMDGGQVTLDLAVHTAIVLAAGQRFTRADGASAEVVKVEWHGEPQGDLRRAHLVASGPRAVELVRGDLLNAGP